MSSATSIKGAAGAVAHPDTHAAGRGDKDGLRPWHFFVLLSLLAATVAVVLARQPAPEHLVLLTIAVGAAGACAAALYATLAPLVRKQSAEDRAPLSERARAALEREKMLVLRSIKELEFDRGMGKLSPADYDEMAGRLRARALYLMKQLDAAAPVYRTAIEQELASRLERAAARSQDCRCGTANDPDASFCKRCGTRLVPTPSAASGTRES